MELAFSPLRHLPCVCRYICLQEKLLQSASWLSKFHKVEMTLFLGWKVLKQRMHSKNVGNFHSVFEIVSGQEIYICLQDYYNITILSKLYAFSWQISVMTLASFTSKCQMPKCKERPRRSNPITNSSRW